MKKQTAVDWLIDKISEKQTNGFYVIDSLEDVVSVFEQAKEMERQQIIDAHGIKLKKSIEKGVDVWEQTTGEQYFTETYGE